MVYPKFVVSTLSEFKLCKTKGNSRASSKWTNIAFNRPPTEPTQEQIGAVFIAPIHEISVKITQPNHTLYTLRWGGIASSQSARLGLNRPPASLPAPLAPSHGTYSYYAQSA